jgi:HlyD family secretion protein/adhesin transport system membrane fusion protein
VTVFDALPLLAAIQSLVVLGYLLARRRASFGNEVAQLVTFAALAAALFGELGITNWLALPAGFGRIAAIAWVAMAAASVLFCRDALRIVPHGRQGWPALLVLPAIALALTTTIASGSCEGSSSCLLWPRIEAGWGAVVAAVCLWVIGRKLAIVYPILRVRPKGPSRLAVAGSILGVLGLHMLEALAYAANPEVAHTTAAATASLGFVMLMQIAAFAVIRLYPEGEEDVPLDLSESGQIDRFRRHLAQAIVFEEGGVGPMVRGTMVTTIMTVVALIVWSAVTPVKEVAVTNGQVLPSSFIRPIQHLEGGIVQHVMVREGQYVKQGEVLLRLDPAQAMSELEQMRARESGLALRAERLRAFAEGRAPDFSQASDDPSGSFQAQDQGIIYGAQEQARQSALLVLEKQIDQRHSDIQMYQDQISAMTQQIDLLGKEVAIREVLAEKGLTSQIVLLNIEREYERLMGERSRSQGQLKTARDALAEAVTRLRDQRSKMTHDAYNEMGTVTAELAQLREARSKLEDRVERLEITAPVNGIVQELSVTSPGTVIQQGAVVTKIVPVDDLMMVETQITPRDIGHVKTGQPVRIKVASYDFARFGAVTGTITQVSPSTFLDEKKAPYYKGTVALDKAYVGDNPELNHVLPGMTVQVDVVTGEKTILQYLLKPIYLAATQAFQER